MTLTELIVALGIASLLIVFFVAASLFIQNYIRTWQAADVLAEELAFLRKDITQCLASARQINISTDSLVCVSPVGLRTTYRVADSSIFRNGRRFNRESVNVSGMTIIKIELPLPATDSILKLSNQECRVGLYDVLLAVMDKTGRVDSIQFIVRNNHEYFKFAPH